MKYFKIILAFLASASLASSSAGDTPSEQLRKVLQNNRLSDGEMAKSIKTLMQQGAVLPKESLRGFYSIEEMKIVDSEAEFQRLYPYHRQSYEELFPVCDPSKLVSDEEFLCCSRFRNNKDSIELLNKLIEKDKPNLFAYIYSHTDFINNKTLEQFFLKAINDHKPDICKFLLTQKYNLSRTSQKFWVDKSPWTLDELKDLAKHMGERAKELFPFSSEFIYSDDELVWKMAVFIVYARSLDTALAKDTAYMEEIVEGIDLNKVIGKSTKAIVTATLNNETYEDNQL